MSNDDNKPKLGGRSLRQIVQRAKEAAERTTFHTIMVGAGRSVPLHEGGSGPDEPTWYFDVEDQFNVAVALAEQLHLPITIGFTERLPDDERVSDADEFGEYAKLQVAEGAPTVPHTVTQHYQMHCPACGHDDQLQVVASGWYGLTPDGLADTNDTNLEWDEQSPCRCGCGWSGVVKQAKIDESAAWPQGKPY